MNTQTLPRPIPLQRSLALRLFDTAAERLHAALAEWRVRRAIRAEYRLAAQAERQLADLSPRTLQDIGAPQGLVGQRRWQYEQDAFEVSRVLNLRGW